MTRVRSVIVAVVLIAIGAVGATVFTPPRAATERETTRIAGTARGPTPNAARGDARGDSPQRATLERQIRLLTAKVAAETAKRQQLEEQVAALGTQLAALAGGAPAAEPAASASAPETANAHPIVAAAPASDAHADTTLSAMERALVAAGIDAATAADMKRRQDELAMDEIYLRDQATREQWLDSPRFKEELAAIEAQRTSIRDEIGDDAYDRYLFAQGHTNRVRVDDVMLDSVAAQAGLQAGDIVLRYGDLRIFRPEDLVNETRAGRAGESIRLEIVRNGARLEVDVPRGPLGLRIAAAQAEPTS